VKGAIILSSGFAAEASAKPAPGRLGQEENLARIIRGGWSAIDMAVSAAQRRGLRQHHASVAVAPDFLGVFCGRRCIVACPTTEHAADLLLHAGGQVAVTSHERFGRANSRFSTHGLPAEKACRSATS